jgi:hypothetical protein
MCVNAKMRPVETLPEMGGIKENDGEGEFKYVIRIFVNATIYRHPAQQ